MAVNPVPRSMPRASAGSRLAWHRAIVAAFVVTFTQPATWVVALAGFLAGGGLILLAWPILVLPTPSGLQNLLGAPVATLAFGSPSPEFWRLLTQTVISGVALFVGGLLAGAWAERRGIAMVLVAAEEAGYTAPVPRLATLPAILQVAVVRAAALIPPLIVFAAAWPTLYAVTYHELILPEDLVTPLPVRVIAQLPVQLAILLLMWGLADTAAALAVRRLIVERRSLVAAWALGWVDLARRPHRVVPLVLLGDLALLVALVPALAASAYAWGFVRDTLESAPDSPIGILVVALWILVWLGSLAVTAVGAAIRAALLTMDSARNA